MNIRKFYTRRHLVDADTNVYGRKDGMVGRITQSPKSCSHVANTSPSQKNFTMLYKCLTWRQKKIHRLTLLTDLHSFVSGSNHRLYSVTFLSGPKANLHVFNFTRFKIVIWLKLQDFFQKKTNISSLTTNISNI